jgi:hypothetical protein
VQDGKRGRSPGLGNTRALAEPQFLQRTSGQLWDRCELRRIKADPVRRQSISGTVVISDSALPSGRETTPPPIAGVGEPGDGAASVCARPRSTGRRLGHSTFSGLRARELGFPCLLLDLSDELDQTPSPCLLAPFRCSVRARCRSSGLVILGFHASRPRPRRIGQGRSHPQPRTGSKERRAAVPSWAESFHVGVASSSDVATQVRNLKNIGGRKGTNQSFPTAFVHPRSSSCGRRAAFH